MSEKRKAELFGGLVDALCDHLLKEDYDFVFKEIVGMTDKEMKELDLKGE